MQDSARSQTEAAHAQRTSLVARKEQKDGLVQALNEKVERDNIELEKRLSEQIEEIESERRETETRLQDWMEEERRVFEERLRKHVESETTALELRLSKKLESINQERLSLRTRMASHLELQERLLEANAGELAALMHELQAGEAARRQDAEAVGAYDKDFDEGTTAISTDMEVFSSNVVEVVQHIYQELLRALELANQQTEEETKSVLSQVESAGAQFVGHTTSALDDIVCSNRRVVDDMLQSMQAKNSTTTTTLQDISASLSTLTASTATLLTDHSTSVQSMTSQLSLFEDNMRNAVSNLEEVEGRCLSQEYQTYSPTGKTPSRTEYRYPRSLAATSPHDRILARFRAMRQNSHDDDCIMVESDIESRTASDCESSLEEFSVFVAPSPPAPATAPATPRLQPIVKCTSETDIYYKRNQDNGKENANRSMNYKKPSKLPAAASHKKPFVERNGNDN